MAVTRHQEPSSAEQVRQEGLNASWAAAQEALADPGFRAYLEASIARVNASTSTRVLTRRVPGPDRAACRVVPLREIGEFRAWVVRGAPSPVAQRIVRTFLVEVSDTPWRWPSVPIPELSNQPEYEMRTAVARRRG